MSILPNKQFKHADGDITETVYRHNFKLAHHYAGWLSFRGYTADDEDDLPYCFTFSTQWKYTHLTLYWYIEKEIGHRENKPSHIYFRDGELDFVSYMFKGDHHHFFGPAMEKVNFSKSYWIFGYELKNASQHREAVQRFEQGAIRLQRIWRARKMNKFLQLTMRNRDFAERFWAPEAMGGRWAKKKLQSICHSHGINLTKSTTLPGFA